MPEWFSFCRPDFLPRAQQQGRAAALLVPELRGTLQARGHHDPPSPEVRGALQHYLFRVRQELLPARQLQGSLASISRHRARAPEGEGLTVATFFSACPLYVTGIMHDPLTGRTDGSFQFMQCCCFVQSYTS